MTEVERLFEMLDAGAIGAPGLAGASPASIEALVARMRAAGLRIELVGSSGTHSSMTPLDTTANASIVYRVVQESLTNIARHAPEASARVEITGAAHHVFVRVSDDGRSVGLAPQTPRREHV